MITQVVINQGEVLRKCRYYSKYFQLNRLVITKITDFEDHIYTIILAAPDVKIDRGVGEKLLYDGKARDFNERKIY